MAKNRNAATNIALRMARGGLCLQQKQVGALVAWSESQVKEIENGRKSLSQSEYEAAMEKLGVPLSVAPVLLGVAEVLNGSEGKKEEDPFDLPHEVRSEIERAALDAAAETRRTFLEGAYALRFAADRAEAAGLWDQLAAPEAARRKPLAAAKRFARWAVVERLCRESTRVAPHDPKEAVSLARLAVALAGKVRGSAPFRGRLEAYGRAHLGNALRVSNDLEGADREFARVAALWTSPLPAEPCPLDESRPIDLEASLRRAQRRFPLALELIDRAIALVTGGGPATGRLLLNKAVIFEQAGDSESAIAMLQEALHLVDASQDRLPCVARFNLAVNLLSLDRVEEAAALVPVVRALALDLHLDLDLLRVDWLEGRLAAGQGRRAEAVALIGAAGDRFVERRMYYDAALASLDLAALLLESGDGAGAAARVTHAAPIFNAWGIDRETLASLRLFLDAIQQQRATAVLARAAAQAWRHFGGEPPRKALQ